MFPPNHREGAGGAWRPPPAPFLAAVARHARTHPLANASVPAVVQYVRALDARRGPWVKA